MIISSWTNTDAHSLYSGNFLYVLNHKPNRARSMDAVRRRTFAKDILSMKFNKKIASASKYNIQMYIYNTSNYRKMFSIAFSCKDFSSCLMFNPKISYNVK